MNSKVVMVLRILLGLFVLVFGLNKFLHFIPYGEMSEAGAAYMGSLAASKTEILVAIVEIVAGLSLLFNKYAALMLLILMSVSVNAVLFHAVLEPASIPGALILFILNAVLIYAHKDKYKDLLNG